MVLQQVFLLLSFWVKWTDFSLDDLKSVRQWHTDKEILLPQLALSENNTQTVPQDSHAHKNRQASNSRPTANILKKQPVDEGNQTFNFEDVIWEKLMQEPADGNTFRYMFFYFIKDGFEDFGWDLSEDDVIKAASPKFEAKNYRKEMVGNDAKYDVLEDIILFHARNLLLMSKRRRFLKKEAERKGQKYVEKSLGGIFNEMLYTPNEIDIFQINKIRDRIYAAGCFNDLVQAKLYVEQRKIEKMNNANMTEPEECTDKELATFERQIYTNESMTLDEVVFQLRLKAREKYGSIWRQKYFAAGENPQGERFRKVDKLGNVYYSTVPKIPVSFKSDSEYEKEEAYGTPYIVEQIKKLLETNQPASQKLIEKIWDVWFMQEEAAEEGRIMPGGDLEGRFWDVFMLDSDDKGNSAFRRSFLENLRTLDELQAEPVSDDLKPEKIAFALPWSDEEYESKEDLLIYWVRTRILATQKQKYLDRARFKKGIDVSGKKLSEILNQKYNTAFDQLKADINAIKPETHLLNNMENLGKKQRKEVEDALKEVDRLQFNFDYDKFYQLPRLQLAEQMRRAISLTEADSSEPTHVMPNEVTRFAQYAGLWMDDLKPNGERLMLLDEFVFNNRFAVVKRYGRKKWKAVYFSAKNCPQCFRHSNKIVSPATNNVAPDKRKVQKPPAPLAKQPSKDKINVQPNKKETVRVTTEAPRKTTTQPPPIPDIEEDPEDEDWVKTIEDMWDQALERKLQNRRKPEGRKESKNMGKAKVKTKTADGGTRNKHSGKKEKQFNDILNTILSSESDGVKESERFKKQKESYSFKIYADDED